MALVANTLHGVGDPGSLLAEVAAALDRDGRLAVVNWRDEPREATPVAGEPRGPPADRRMGPAETEAVARGADLTVLDRVELPPHHYGVVFDR